MHSVPIVDDHADIRGLLALTLSRCCAFFEASDARSAIDATRCHQPQQVVDGVKARFDLAGAA